MDYNLTTNSMVYMDPGIVGVVQGFTVNLEVSLLKLLAAEYLEVQTPETVTSLSQLKTTYSIGTTDATLKGYS